MAIIRAISSYVQERLRYRSVVQELSALTDRELCDIGINRSDIHRVAHEDMMKKRVA